AVLVPAGAISQTPRPSHTMISAHTAANRRRPPRAARKPSTSSGTLLEATCPKPKWTKALGTTSTSSPALRGRTPKPSSRCPDAASTTSSSHSRATQATITTAAVLARSPLDHCLTVPDMVTPPPDRRTRSRPENARAPLGGSPAAPPDRLGVVNHLKPGETTRTPWIVGVSGASGTPYAAAVLRALLQAGESVDLVVSRASRLTLLDETGVSFRDAHWRDDLRQWLSRGADGKPDTFAVDLDDVRYWPAGDLAAGPSSGSYPSKGMLIVPASTACVAGVALGLSKDLLQRAASVTLKEGRPL